MPWPLNWHENVAVEPKMNYRIANERTPPNPLNHTVCRGSLLRVPAVVAVSSRRGEDKVKQKPKGHAP